MENLMERRTFFSGKSMPATQTLVCSDKKIRMIPRKMGEK